MTGAHRALRWNALWLAIGWLLVALVVYLSLTPQPLELPGAQSDKFGHCLAYAVLMVWFAQLYLQARQRVHIGIELVVLAVGLEFAQRYTGYRTFDVLDMAAGVAGVAIGWLVAPPRGPAFLAYVERRLRLA